MTWFEEVREAYKDKWKRLSVETLGVDILDSDGKFLPPKEAIKLLDNKFAKEHSRCDEKEAPTMKVEYNGFTGELVKLERKLEQTVVLSGMTLAPTGSMADIVYDISIYDSEKKATISFENVNLKDMKFLGGAVSFGG